MTDLKVGTARVLIADRRPINARGLARLISRAALVSVHACCHQVEQLGPALMQEPADAALLDPELFEDDPLHAVEVVRTFSARLAVLLTSSRISDSLLLALGLENVSCVSAYAQPTEVLSSLRSLITGRPVMPQEVQMALASRFRHPPALPSVTLTAREAEVFQLAKTGITTAAIAEALHISHSTAKTYLHRIYRKLGVSNRSAAIAATMTEAAPIRDISQDGPGLTAAMFGPFTSTTPLDGNASPPDAPGSNVMSKGSVRVTARGAVSVGASPSS
jgi:DNA-binding NarL/FixJ family response regulator